MGTTVRPLPPPSNRMRRRMEKISPRYCESSGIGSERWKADKEHCRAKLPPLTRCLAAPEALGRRHSRAFSDIKRSISKRKAVKGYALRQSQYGLCLRPGADDDHDADYR